jgi:hypothetical protein
VYQRERGRELGAASPRLDRHDAEHGGSRGNVYEDTARLEDDAVVQGEPAARGVQDVKHKVKNILKRAKGNRKDEATSHMCRSTGGRVKKLLFEMYR